MTINPAFGPIFEALAPLAALDFATAPVAELRRFLDNPMSFGAPIRMAWVKNVTIELEGRNLDARLYVPEGAGTCPPLTLYFHGGGWVLGTIETHDGSCRALARASNAAVLSVAYRLAPEHRYPKAVDDCFDATCWALNHADRLGVDPERLAVAGDSSGGNLAAVVAILARDAGLQLRHQLLIYPVTDVDFTRPSFVANGGGNYFLSTVAMQRFWREYLGDTAISAAPLAAVLNTADLGRLAPATVITAQYDPLRDEGRAYAQKLAQAGVAVEAHEAPGMIHGFFAMFEMIPEALPWIEVAGAALRRSFAG